MSLNTVGATISRSLRATGTTRTPSFARSPEVGRFSASRWSSTDRSEGRAVKEGRQSQGESATPDRPGSEVPASRELQSLRSPPGDKKTGKEHTGAPGVGGGKKRSFAYRALRTDRKANLWGRYNELKRLVHDQVPPGACNLLNSSTIYANNEVHLAEVDIYGFDYDYTLALYSHALNEMIYNKARTFLIEHFKYPQGINNFGYLDNFAIRGLHYDIQKGLLMKIDAFHYIQPGTVYRGFHAVSDEEVCELYSGTFHVPLQQHSGFYGKGPRVKQFMDIFSIPEMTLLAVANHYFISNHIEYDPVHLFKDVSEAIGMVHLKGYMYKWIVEELDKFILSGKDTQAVLKRLSNHGKKLFLITNSPFGFVNKGMTHMVGEDWRDFFDVVIVQADKPHFFTDCIKPFRQLDYNGDLRWEKISSLEKGHIYKQGNLIDFLRLTGWRGSRVLYFGDHLYSDLADLTLRHGWRTAAIVPELEQETKMVSTSQYAQSLTWLQALTGLIERLQTLQDPEAKNILQEWQNEREELRVMMKNFFNPHFGSIFRTCHNPTYFSRRLCCFSDIYMASLSCLLNYDVDFTFYPRRTPLQHEAPLWMDQLCTGCLKTPHLDQMSRIR